MEPPRESDAAAQTAPPAKWLSVDKGMLSRVLYPNPVCLMTTRDALTQQRNVMTITWLTPINNQGGFVCSMNAGRHSAQFVNRVGAVFVEGMEELVLSIGGCSGASVDKFSQFDLATCGPGGINTPTDESPVLSPELQSTKKQKLSKQELNRLEVRKAAAHSVALRDCVAHVLSRVDRIDQDDGHLLLRCTQLAAWCRDGYWDGKNFMPKHSNSPPFLTFLGSKVFGYVRQRATESSSSSS